MAMRDMEAFRRLVYDKADRALAERRRKRGMFLRVGSTIAVICIVCGVFLYSKLPLFHEDATSAAPSYAGSKDSNALLDEILCDEGPAESPARQKLMYYAISDSAASGAEIYRAESVGNSTVDCVDGESGSVSFMAMNSFSKEPHFLSCDVAYEEDSVTITVYVDQTPTDDGEYVLTVPISLKKEFSEDEIEEIWVTK